MAAELSRLRLGIATKEQQSIPRCRRLFELTPELADVPPNWATALAVADTDATCKLAEELGGKVLVSPVDLPNSGRYAVIQDPVGRGLPGAREPVS